MLKKRGTQKSPRREAAKETKPRSRWALWALSAFLICWAFILGVLVGQGSLANPEQVASIKQAVGWERFFGPDSPPPPQRLKDPDLKFYDRVKQQRPAAATAPAKPTAKPAPQAKPVPQVAAKSPDKPSPAPAPEAKAPEKPAAVPTAKPADAKGRFAVQVASFSEKRQALDLARRLQDSGYRAYMLIVNVQGAGRRFRVRVGPYAELDAAQGAASRIRLQHKLAAYVTRAD
ncbi:MAG: SPOR domain-containing protein [Desulfarculaceae bacterium]|nr:SPOR domain-containing protein [Desulfarculaceae bacterium]